MVEAIFFGQHMRNPHCHFYLMLIAFLLTSAVVGRAQEGNIWHFGTNAGLDFNSGVPVALTDGELSTEEGCSSIADAQGNLLFYTDGIRVWNQTHNQMPNGFGLMGNSSASQSVIIVPRPQTPNRYYIFTVPAVGNPPGLRYSEVDMQLNGGLGAVIGSTKNTALATPVTEKLCSVVHGNGSDLWVLAHGWQSNIFYAYLITAAGVSAPITTNVGLQHTATGNSNASRGCMKVSVQGDKLALAIVGNGNLGLGTPEVEVFDFDNVTGIPSNVLSLNPSFPLPYGIEFSPDGSKLYVTSWAVQSPTLYQYNLAAGSNMAIINSAAPLAISTLYGTAQLAPDGKIYIAQNGAGGLHVINAPNANTIASNFVTNQVPLSGKISRLGLPNFPPSLFLKAQFTCSELCLGDTTQFFVIFQNADSWSWDFGDPASGAANSSTLPSPGHFYTDTGSYTARLIAAFGNTSDTVLKTIRISIPPTVDLGSDTGFCAPGSILINSNFSNATYLWSDNSTAQQLLATAADLYSVTVTNACGVASDSIEISEDSPFTLNLGQDQTLCENNLLPIDPNLSGVSYLWQDGSTDPTFTPSASGLIWLEASNACTTQRDSMQVIVLPTPVVQLPNDTAICNDSGFVVTVASDESFTLFWQDGSTDTVRTLTESGNYWVLVGNGCGAFSDTFSLSIDPLDDFDLGVDTIICAEASLELSAQNSSPSASYLWQNGSEETSINVTTEGIYSVLITSGKCTVSDSISVLVDERVCSQCYLDAPNVFTPNNDGLNESFLVSSECAFSNYRMTIFNRWGALLFESEDPTHYWDGTFKKEEVPSGVYFWVVEFEIELFDTGRQQLQKGSFTLLRD